MAAYMTATYQLYIQTTTTRQRIQPCGNLADSNGDMLQTNVSFRGLAGIAALALSSQMPVPYLGS